MVLTPVTTPPPPAAPLLVEEGINESALNINESALI
jgi:hypothetical protein